MRAFLHAGNGEEAWPRTGTAVLCLYNTQNGEGLRLYHIQGNRKKDRFGEPNLS